MAALHIVKSGLTGAAHLRVQLERLWLEIDRIEEASAEAYDRDSEFDGGEWSGPAVQRQMHRLSEAAAKRFGFESVEVAWTVWTALAVKGAEAEGRQ